MDRSRTLLLTTPTGSTRIAIAQATVEGHGARPATDLDQPSNTKNT
jgi:hypothetical protein